MPLTDEGVICQDEQPKKLWEGSFQLGLNGSDGNTEVLNFRLGLDAKRKTEDDVLAVKMDYRKASSDSKETANQAILDWRYEWGQRVSRLSPYVHGTLEYDQLQAWDLRVSLDTGLGARLVCNETTKLTARAGGGWSREVGGPDEEFVPEGVFNCEFEHQLTRRQKITAALDYFPRITDFCDYRLRTRGGWEVLLDKDRNLSLKLAVLERYDSRPNGKKPGDLDYTVLLLWKF